MRGKELQSEMLLNKTIYQKEGSKSYKFVLSKNIKGFQ